MYVYENLKPGIFTEDGQTMFLEIRDRVKKILSQSGAITMGVAMAGGGDSWERMACVDRLVELREIKEINYGECAGQHRIFVDPLSR